MKRVIILLLILHPFFGNAQTITTVAGGGTILTDGVPATAAQIPNPGGGNFDKNGDYYFGQSFTNPKIRKINTAGIISTVAGNGVSGFSGDNGPATAAMISFALAAVDATGNIYIADRDNHRVRKVDALTGIITTIAGKGFGGYSGDGGQATNASIYPNSICTDTHGNVFVLDSATRIRKINSTGIITTIAGTGDTGHTGDGGLATLAKINPTYGLCVDVYNNLYIGCYGWIRCVNLTSGIISTIAGNGNYTFNGDEIPATTAQINPFEIATDVYGDLYISDYLNQRIRKIDKYGFIHTIAGTGVGGYFGDGDLASLAEVYDPEGIAIDSCGNLYVADEANNRIRKITYPKCGYLAVPDVANNELTIYPNPTYDILNVDNLKTPAAYTLQSLVGTPVQQGILKEGNNIINIQAVPNGMYLLEIMDNKEQKKIVKMIKQ